MAKAATSSRRAAREAALRVLYTMDVGKQTLDEVLSAAAPGGDDADPGEAAPLPRSDELDEKGQAFARDLAVVTAKSIKEIDTVLDRLAVGFPTVRQTAVDRNILRLAAAEILFHASDAPPGAVVNEAVELAKKYSTTESGRFVNGVLGALVREVEQNKAAPDEATQKSGDV